MDDIAASVYPEQSPETRAERALNLLHVFKEADDDGPPWSSEEVETALGDLLCDLHHLADTLHAAAWKDSLLMAAGHYEAERYDCECADDLLPGAFYPMAKDGDESVAWVERCDNCRLFDCDETAAEALAAKLGVGYIDYETPDHSLSGWVLTELQTDPRNPRPLPFGYRGNGV